MLWTSSALMFGIDFAGVMAADGFSDSLRAKTNEDIQLMQGLSSSHE